MKKILVFILLICPILMSISVLAYDLNKDDKIYVGGEAIGIKVNNGVTVVGTYGIYSNGKMIKPWENAGLQEGDKITSLNNHKITDIKSLLKALNYSRGDEVEITFIRKNQIKNSKIQPAIYNDSYSLGLYVKDSILGVGTLTYYIEEINTFGSLGHQLTKDDYYSGNIYEAKVTDIVKPSRGEAGEKKATIEGEAIGTI